MPIFEVQGQDGATFEVDAPDQAAALAAFQKVGQPEREKGSILPMSWDKGGGNARLDMSAGLPGAVMSAIKAPREAYEGKFDPRSEEGHQRAFETASLITPIPPGMRVSRPIPPKAPTAQELKGAAKAGYKAVKATGTEYRGSSIAGLSDDVTRALNEEGFVDRTAPQTLGLLKDLRPAPGGSVVTIQSLDAARKALNRIAGNFSNPTEQEAARRAISALDDFIAAGGQAPSVAGAAPAKGLPAPWGPRPADQAAKLLTEARGNRAAAFRSDRLTGIEEAAQNRAAATGSGQNIGNAERQRLASLLGNPKRLRGFSEKEIDAIRQVVRGTATSNTLRYVSNLLGGGGGIAQYAVGASGAGAGALLGGPVGAGTGAALGMSLPPAIGATSRSAYNRLVPRQLNRVDEQVRMRSPLYQQRMADAPTQIVAPQIQAAMVRSLLESLPEDQRQSLFDYVR